MLGLHQGSKRRWTKSEDERLVAYVGECLSIEDVDWANVSSVIQGRSAKQARERYLNVLDPRISHEPWSEVRGGGVGRWVARGGAGRAGRARKPG
jgi:Myb-like DNA-binding domain